MSDSSPAAAGAPTLSRRALLAAALAGTAVAVAGCTGGGDGGTDAVTRAQIDHLADQVAVQAALVAAFDRALAGAPALAGTATVLADQARQQLDRLRAATPSAGSPAAASGRATATSESAAGSAAPLDPAGARAWLRAEVARAADAHAAACPGFSGGRAALLGSIAAGLRGMDGQLA